MVTKQNSGNKILALALTFALILGMTPMYAAAEPGMTVTFVNASATEPAEPDIGLTFSREAGLYNASFSLALDTTITGAVIRYTTNGADPTSISPAYSSPISITNRTSVPVTDDLSLISNIAGGTYPYRTPNGTVSKGNVIKAQVFSAAGEPLSEVFAKSYFINLNYANLPVISLMADRDDFFHPATGIYADPNFEEKGPAWERPVHFEMFVPGKQEAAVSLNMGLRIDGGYDRNSPQKSLLLYAGSEYDEQTFVDYDLFEGRAATYDGDILTQFKRFSLLHGATDNWQTMLRDALAQDLMRGTHAMPQAYRQAAVFINGEYWGLYNIREHIDEEGIALKYGLGSADGVGLLAFSAQTPADPDYPVPDDYDENDPLMKADYEKWLEMHHWLTTGIPDGVMDDTQYDKAQTFIDIDNFIDYYILRTYADDTDWPGSNLAVWRYRGAGFPASGSAPKHGEDGRWRWMLKNLDCAFASQTGDSRFDSAVGDDPFAILGQDDWSTRLWRILNTNGRFMDQFINRYNDLMNTHFHPDVVNTKINGMRNDIRPYIIESWNRWPHVQNMGATISQTYFDNQINVLRNFAAQRPDIMYSRMETHTALRGFPLSGGKVTVNLKTPDTGKGHMVLNGMPITTDTPGVTNPANWSGIYYSGKQQTVLAVPAPGQKFEGWYDGDGNPVSQSSEYTFAAGNLTLEARFRLEESTPISGGNIINMSDPDPISSGDGWSYAANVYIIRNGADVTVIGDNSGSQRRISVWGTVKITLYDVNITGLGSNLSPILLNNGADVTLNLKGSSALTAGTARAGIQTPAGTTLTIEGSGSLTATGGEGGAGIGGGSLESGGTVTINGGNIEAIAGDIGNAAAIGMGNYGFSAGTVAVNGTYNYEVNLVNNASGASSGRGKFVWSAGYKYIKLEQAPISIGDHIDMGDPAPLSSGDGWTYSGDVYSIEDGADVTVTGDNAGSERRISVNGLCAAKITLDNATIAGLVVNQTPLFLNSGANVTLTLTGDNTLTAGNNRAGIQTTGAALTIDGTGSLNIKGGAYGAGIGGVNYSDGGTITINGGTVTATGGHESAAIGGGSQGAGGTITISGGTVTAISGDSPGNQAAIGRGNNGADGTVTITGYYNYWTSTTSIAPGTKTGSGEFIYSNTYQYIKLVERAASNACDITGVTTPGGAMISGTDITANVAYDVSSQTIVITVSPGATWELYSDDGCLAKIDDKTATLLPPGQSTTVYIKVTAEDGTSEVYTVTISRAKTNPTVTWPTGLTAAVGQTLSEITLPGNGTSTPAGTFTWTTPGDSVGGVGTQSHSMTFTPNDTANYNTLTQNVSVTVGAVPITTAAITVHAPATGDLPNTAASTTDMTYTVGAVSWTPNDNPFLGSTVYTATVTLTANANHTFTGLTGATINGHNATVSGNTGAAVTLSYIFGATPAKAVTDIAILSQPTNLTYTHGDALVLSGLEVTLTYSDSTTENVAYADFGSFNIETIPAGGTALSHTLHDGQPVTVEIGGHSDSISNLTVGKFTPTVSNGGVQTIATAGRGDQIGNLITLTVSGVNGETFTGTWDCTAPNSSGGTATATFTHTGGTADPDNYTGGPITATVTVTRATGGGTVTPPTTPSPTLTHPTPPDTSDGILTVEKAAALAEAGKTHTVETEDNIIIVLDPDALAILAAAHDVGTTPITVEASIVPMKDLKGMQAAQVKGYETVINLDVFVGDEKIDVPLTVSLPYTLKANENPAAVRVWHMDADGNLTDLNGVYDEKTGMITFTISHQSYFVVGYDPVTLWANIFSDIAEGAWYYDAVAYANYHGLFAGDGQGHFMPQDSMTRAMFVTVLWNLEQLTIDNEQLTIFTDVLPGAWYYNAVQWAAKSGIVSGVGGGKYAPDRQITRQEMAVMLYNYAGFKGYDIPENRPLPAFTDSHRIDLWAKTAAEELAEAGVLSDSGGEFKPQDTATRAEVAQMFKNFLRFIVGG